jgi:hypothetical protein
MGMAGGEIMRRLKWTAWMAVFLAACPSSRDRLEVVKSAAGPQLPGKAPMETPWPKCKELRIECPECYVQILNSSKDVLLTRCGDDLPGACCPCGPEEQCCPCGRPAGEPDLPPIEEGKSYIVRVGDNTMVRFEKTGREEKGFMEFSMKDPLPMTLTCLKRKPAPDGGVVR